MLTVSIDKRRLSIGLAAAVLVVGILACGTTTNPQQNSGSAAGNGSNLPGTAAGSGCVSGIIPGTTTRSEVIALLGQPVGTIPENGFETLLYNSWIPRQYNSYTMKDGVVAYVSIVLGDQNPIAWSEVTALFGKPVYMAYSNYLQGSFTYIYPDMGQTFVASPDADAVFIHECFAPVSIQDYMNTWGSQLPTSDPFSG